MEAEVRGVQSESSNVAARKLTGSSRRPKSWGTLRSLIFPLSSSSSTPTTPTKKVTPPIRARVNEEDFELGQIIGRGSYSSVRIAKKKTEPNYGERYAIKQIHKDTVDLKKEARARKEGLIMAHLRGSPFILSVQYAFQNKVDRFLAFEYFAGGSLQTQLDLAFFSKRSNKRSCFSEKRAKFHAAEMLLALQHMHSRKVAHRDIKLDNILMDHLGHIAIGDFGLARLNVEPGREPCKTFCGTVEYLAPEILKGELYGLAVDWWAFGISVFEMLYGRTPFYHSSPRQMFTWILRKSFTDCLSLSPRSMGRRAEGMIPLSSTVETNCSYGTNKIQNAVVSESTMSSPRAKLTPSQSSVNEFLATAIHLLDKNPASRLSCAQQVIQSPWFNDIDYTAMETLSIEPPFKPQLLPLDDDDEFDDGIDNFDAVVLPILPPEEKKSLCEDNNATAAIIIRKSSTSSSADKQEKDNTLTSGQERAFIFMTDDYLLAKYKDDQCQQSNSTPKLQVRGRTFSPCKEQQEGKGLKGFNPSKRLPHAHFKVELTLFHRISVHPFITSFHRISRLLLFTQFFYIFFYFLYVIVKMNNSFLLIPASRHYFQ